MQNYPVLRLIEKRITFQDTFVHLFFKKNGKKKKTKVLIYSCKLPLVYILSNANPQEFEEDDEVVAEIVC